MSQSDLLILERVSVGYPERMVLEEVNLQLQRGCFTALVGANGSGKSTLLRTMLGLLPPIRGKTLLAGSPPPRLGYVPQRDRLDPLFLFTSLEVVLQGACARVGPGRFPGRQEKDWARECLQQAGAADLDRQSFAQLSGGQKQRVLIARALATRPDLLFLDEPTAGIDQAATEGILQLLQGLRTRQAMSIVLVSHELSSLRNLVEDVIWLRRGRVFKGPANQLLTPEKIGEMLGQMDLFS